MPRGSIDIRGASVGIFADSDATNTRITLGDRDADPIGTAADGTANACNPMIHACISTRGAQGHGVSLGTFGAADPDNDPETEDNLYEIITRPNSRISTQGTGAHGIVLRDTPNSTAQANLSLFGEIVVTGQDAIGVNIADSTGGATFGFFVPGRISATGNANTAIQDAAAATNLSLSSTTRITGDINLGGGNDAITLAAGARVAGDIDLGAGNDTLNIRTTLTGNVDGGAGDDTFTFRPGGEITGTLAGGMGDDTLNFLLLSDAQRRSVRLTDAMTGTGTASFLNTDGTAGVAGFTGIETLTGQVEEFSGLADSHARWTLAPMDIRYQALTAAASDPGAMDFGLPLTLPATTNLLAGANLSDTFIISTAFQGSLNGGTGNDVFRFQPNGAIASNLTGGAGADHLDYSARPGFIQAELAASDADGFSGTATAISGSFFGIDQLTGGMDSSQLIGLDSDATWTLGVDAQGNERNTYALIRAVPAGGPAATDTLIFSGFDGLAANVTGMADNTFNIDRDHQASIVISGRGGDDVFNIRATVRSQFDIALVGSSGDDRFIFANDGAVLSGNTSTGDISGASGNDSLQGDNDGNAFTLTGSNQGTLAEKIAGQFFNIENLIGGTGADTFTFDDAGNLTGNLTGGAGTDTLTGDNNGNTFSLTGGNNGQLADSAGTALIENGFTGIENLTGGTGNDRFAFAAAGSLSGSISGGAGTDHLDYSARTDSLSATLTDSDATGFAGGAVMAAVAARQTSITGGFTGINQLTGGTATDSLTGDDADATWTVGADEQGNERNSYALMRSVVGGQPVTDTLTFSSFDNLTGGSLADTFNIDAAHSGDLDGGAGADTFNIANTLMGNIDGGTGDDTFTFSGAGAITGTLAGGTGDDTLNFMALSDVERLSVMMTDAVTGTGVASFINGGGAAGFTGIENLDGFLMRFTGDANRHARWTLASAGNSYQALTAPASDPNAETVGASINLTASVNTLVGGDLSDTFDIATAFDGTLQGGAGDNTFTFADGGSIAGSITGGMGTDHLDYGGRTAPIRVTLTASDATGFAGGPVVATRTQTPLTGGFTGINQLTGGTATDSLTGHNADATWTLGTAGNSYAVGNQSLVFSNFENLIGGSMADSFTLSIDHTGNLDAGAGDDVFNLADGGEVGEIAGGAGTDHLDYSRRTDAATFNVTLARRDAGGFSGTAPATAGFSGINQLTGRQGDSRLIGMDVSAIWTLDTAGNSYTGTGGQTQDPLRFAGFATLIGRSNADSFTINGDYTGDIIGGGGADAFIFGNDGSLSGNLTGGDGDDRLQGDDDDNRFTLSARNEGTLDGKIGGRFFGIENLTGGSGADTFTFEDSGEISGTLEGGMGTDHLDYTAAAQTPSASP